jgi:hypothetical protein
MNIRATVGFWLRTIDAISRGSEQGHLRQAAAQSTLVSAALPSLWHLMTVIEWIWFRFGIAGAKWRARGGYCDSEWTPPIKIHSDPSHATNDFTRKLPA